MDDRLARLAGSFGAAADLYERARPHYPEAAIDWLLPDGARDVLDLGAGTGKLTRQLQARGLEVVAVEPSDGMRSQLEAVVPGVRALPGRAEEIPLPDASVDAVLAAQAWHWVDVERAVPEVARVLRPGGRLGLVWNKRDERVDWVAELGELMAGGVDGAIETMDSDDPVVGPPFGPIERRDFEWTHSMTHELLLDMVASRSYFIVMPADEREARLAQVRRFTERQPALGGARFELPMVARCARTRLR